MAVRQIAYTRSERTTPPLFYPVSLCANSNLLHCLLAGYLVIRYSRTYQKDYDAFGNGILPSQLGTLILLIPCVAAVTQPRLSLTHDLMWLLLPLLMFTTTTVNIKALIACPHFFSQYF